MDGKDIWASRSGFAHEIVISGDITIGNIIVFEFTWMAQLAVKPRIILKSIFYSDFKASIQASTGLGYVQSIQ